MRSAATRPLSAVVRHPSPVLRLPRREFLQLGGAALAAPALVSAAAAQTYPSRPITMIVPFPPGGNVDVVGRILAERMRADAWAAHHRRKHRRSERKHRYRPHRPREARRLYD